MHVNPDPWNAWGLKPASLLQVKYGACLMSTAQQSIRIGQSLSKNPHHAVLELYEAINQPDAALVVFFCSSYYDLDAIAREINSFFPNQRVIGCTTSGEIGPGGYTEHTISGFSLAADGFKVASGFIDDLHHINIDKGHTFVDSLLQQLEAQTLVSFENSFAFLLVDGLSLREEPTARILQDALGQIPLFGGSAGDDLQFKKTWVFSEGAFRTDCAALILINTLYPFKLFKAQHFVCGIEKLVVTQADPLKRIVKEINGYPAVKEYSRIVNLPVEKLNPIQFSAHPLVIRINGVDYVRSIQKLNPDGSLTFYCAIDNGLVFMAAHGIDLIKNLEDTLSDVYKAIGGKPQLLIACDCILRTLEIQRMGLKNDVERIFQENNVVGFSTYGEQYKGIHINQTITGLAIGEIRKKDDV